jgi:hypothetical protein
MKFSSKKKFFFYFFQHIFSKFFLFYDISILEIINFKFNFLKIFKEYLYYFIYIPFRIRKTN